MKTTMKWQGGMKFNASCEGNSITLDAKSPLGQNQGMTPKELLAVGIGGCTAMDVVALLKKHKQNYESLEVDVDVKSTTGITPAVFSEGLVTFKVLGPVSADVLRESVRLSQTKFCGVSAMLSKAFPIRYEVLLNNEKISEGKAEF